MGGGGKIAAGKMVCGKMAKLLPKRIKTPLKAPFWHINSILCMFSLEMGCLGGGMKDRKLNIYPCIHTHKGH